MKKFSEQINERLKLTKDTKLEKPFKKIDIRNIQRGDELYTVNVSINKTMTGFDTSEYGDLLDNKPNQITCTKPLYKINTVDIVCYNMTFSKRVEPLTINSIAVFTEKLLKYYEDDENSILMGLENTMILLLFVNEDDAQKFINKYSLYKDQLLSDYEKYLSSELRNIKTFN